MKTRGFLTMLVLTILALASSGMAAEACSADTVKGTYALTSTGWVSLTPTNPTAVVPYAAQGIFTDKVVGGELVSSGTATASFGGIQVVDVYTSTATTVNSDCTGSITFQVIGFETFTVSINFVVLDQGKEILGFTTGDGNAVTTNLRLMSRNTD